MNIEEKRSTLQREISNLRASLQPASEDAIAARIIAMHEAGLSYPQAINPKKARAAYSFALRGCAIEALRITSIKILRGEIPTIRRFLPTPPELAALVREEHSRLSSEARSARDQLEALEYQPQPKRTPEEQARAEAVVARARNLIKSSARPADGISNSDPEYWSKIAALKDRPHVYPEHEKFRERVKSTLEEQEASNGES